MSTYQTFIGLEVHIHLLTKSKVFCACKSAFGDAPNTNVCPVCMGLPGVLPTLNIEAMRMGCLTARALNCTIPETTWFERKQYFYPDMTKNYQISQFASPLGQNGWMEIESKGIKKRVRIHECHLEEDAGKMIHTGNVSLLDYNRAGVALLEIVTEPDMASGEEAELFIQQLRRTVRYLGVCDGNMEEGSLRADANISINLPGKGLGRKVEIKNLNSSRFVRLGLNYEAKRQAEVLDAGKQVIQETRLWNENRDQTEIMRTKENAHDYRYFPEPDLPPFKPDAEFLASVDAMLVELPLERQRRFMRDYALPEDAAAALCEEKALADYFELVVDGRLPVAGCRLPVGSDIPNTKPETGNQKPTTDKIRHLILTDLRHLMSEAGIAVKDIGGIKLKPEFLAELVSLTAAGKVSQKNAKQTLEIAFAEGRSPSSIIAEKGWEQITDEGQIAALVKTVLEQEAASVEEARAAIAAGNAKRVKALSNFLAGKVIAASQGKADPVIAGKLLQKELGM